MRNTTDRDGSQKPVQPFERLLAEPSEALYLAAHHLTAVSKMRSLQTNLGAVGDDMVCRFLSMQGVMTTLTRNFVDVASGEPIRAIVSHLDSEQQARVRAAPGADRVFAAR